MADTQQFLSTEEPIGPASAPTPTLPRNGLGLAALIIGIVAFLGGLVPIINYGTGVVALVGLILGIVALFRRDRRRGVAIAGTVVSGIALIVSVVLAIVYSVAIATVVSESAPAATAIAPVTGGATPGSDAGSDELGSRDNPAPLGTTVEIDSTAGIVDWEVTLGPATLDANGVIAAENQFAEPAPEGFQYAMVPVTVVYRGTDTGTPWAELAVDYVSAAGTTHTSSDSFAVAPTPLTDVNGLAPGASGTGNVVVAVPTADVEKGTWALSTMLGEQYFFTAQ